jgi:hypothetical protein
MIAAQARGGMNQGLIYTHICRFRKTLGNRRCRDGSAALRSRPRSCIGVSRVCLFIRVCRFSRVNRVGEVGRVSRVSTFRRVSRVSRVSRYSRFTWLRAYVAKIVDTHTDKLTHTQTHTHTHTRTHTLMHKCTHAHMHSCTPILPCFVFN